MCAVSFVCEYFLAVRDSSDRIAMTDSMGRSMYGGILCLSDWM